MFFFCYLFPTLKAYRSFLQRNQVEVTLEGLWYLVRRYATKNNSKQFLKCHLFCTLSKSILLLVSTWQALLVYLDFFFQFHVKVSVESTKFCCFFHTQFKSSSLLVTSPTSLSDRERSIKQPNTTVTKLYSNNTSWVARSRRVLESVLDVFMLAWVMSSIAAAQRSQSVAVLFFSPSRCCITVSLSVYISPWRETGFKVTASLKVVIDVLILITFPPDTLQQS